MASYQCRGKNKLWSVRFRVVENGREVTKRLSGYKTKRECQQSYMDFIANYKPDKLKLSDDKIENRSLDSMFEEYLIYKQQKIKDSSIYDIVSIYNNHIRPTLGSRKIKEITKVQVLEWQQSLNSYSYKYKSTIRYVLSSIYRYMYHYHDIDNVVTRVEPFQKPKTKNEINIWSLEEFNKFIETFEGDLLYKTFFTLLYYTGLRLGEATSLSPQDIDLINHKLTVSKNLTTKQYVRGESAYKITTPKNETSYRTILLPQILCNQLTIYIDSIDKNSTFLFGGTKPLDDNTIYRRLREHTTQCGNKPIRVHDFRHSHTSLLIQSGATIVLVAKRLGHKNIEQTLNTYAHLFPNSESELINIIDQLVTK